MEDFKTIIPKGTKFVIEIEMIKDITEKDMFNYYSSIYKSDDRRFVYDDTFVINKSFSAGSMQEIKKQLMTPIMAQMQEFLDREI